LNYFSVICKKGKIPVSSRHKNNSKENLGNSCQKETDMDTLSDPFFFSCSVILSHHGSQSKAEGFRCPPANHICPVVKRDSGYSSGAIAIHRSLKYQIRHTV